MSVSQQHAIRRIRLCLATLLVILTCVTALVLPAAAQSRAPEWELFELPEAADLILGAVPGSDDAVAMLPAEGVSTILLESPAFEQLTAEMLDPLAWQTAPSLELWPGETLVLRTTGGTIFKVTLPPPSASLVDHAPVQLSYAALGAPGAPISTTTLNVYEALDLDSGDMFSDPTIASVVPTPWPAKITAPPTFGWTPPIFRTLPSSWPASATAASWTPPSRWMWPFTMAIRNRAARCSARSPRKAH